MKKLLSIMLAVAMMTTMVCTMVGFEASALETTSLLPANASDFTCKDGGDGSVTVTKEGNAFKFTATAGWPQAFYMGPEDSWAKAYINQECYLNWDFEVKTGGANVLVFYCGQNPADQAAIGTAETINYFIDPANNNEASQQVKDLPVGVYKGSIHVKDIGCGENFMVGEGAEQYFTVSGIKVFAVGGEVIVNDLSIGPKAGEAPAATTAAPANTTAAPANTTAAPANTTAAPANTTTVPQTTAVTPDSAKTGDVSDALLFVIVAIVAGGVVTLSAVASKKSKAR